MVGKGFSDENYGIGLKKGDTAGTAAINAAIAKMIADGSWKKALEDTVGPSGLHDPGAADPEQLTCGARPRQVRGRAPAVIAPRCDRAGRSTALTRRPTADGTAQRRDARGLQLPVRSQVRHPRRVLDDGAAHLLVGDRLVHPRASILAAMRVSPVPLMRGFGTAYVNIFRNVPLTVIIIMTSQVLSRTSSACGWPSGRPASTRRPS